MAHTKLGSRPRWTILEGKQLIDISELPIKIHAWKEWLKVMQKSSEGHKSNDKNKNIGVKADTSTSKLLGPYL